MQTTKQLLQDGLDFVMQFTGYCDDGNQESNVVKVDVSELVDVPQSAKIVKIEYEVSGGVLRILWHSDDPLTFLDLASVNIFSYEDIRGAVNPMTSGANGDILFSTIGFDVGSSYSVKMTLRKKYAV